MGVINTDLTGLRASALKTAYCVGLVGSTLGNGVNANQGYIDLVADPLE